MAKKRILSPEQIWQNQIRPSGKCPEKYSSKILNAIWQLKKAGNS
jgi:hypothetical protein